jgi:hypothetical protein
MREERRLRMFENRFLRRILGLRETRYKWEWKKLYS